MNGQHIPHDFVHVRCGSLNWPADPFGSLGVGHWVIFQRYIDGGSCELDGGRLPVGFEAGVPYVPARLTSARAFRYWKKSDPGAPLFHAYFVRLSVCFINE